jgi:hypothetical protein
MLRVFRHLFDKLKEPNADECPHAAGARLHHHPDLGITTAQETKDSLPCWVGGDRLELRVAECAYHLSLERGECVRGMWERRQLKQKRTNISCLIHTSELLWLPMRSGAWPR